MNSNYCFIDNEDEIVLNYLEKQAIQETTMATEKSTKIWEKIKSHSEKKSPSNNFCSNSSPTIPVGFQISPQEFNMYEFNIIHINIIKNLQQYYNEKLPYKIFELFSIRDFDKLEKMINNINEVVYQTNIFQDTMKSKISTQSKSKIKEEYRKKYDFIQDLVKLTSLQKRINTKIIKNLNEYYSQSLEKDVACKMSFDNSGNMKKYKEISEIIAVLNVEKDFVTQLDNFLNYFEILYIKKNDENNQSHYHEIPLKSEESNKNKRKSFSDNNHTIKPKQSKQVKCVEVIRKKEERKALNGYTCNQCKEFYENVFGKNTDKYKEVIQLCSRHRHKHTPPSTPPGFWDIDIQTPEEWIIQDEELAKIKELENTNTLEYNHNSQNTQSTEMTLIDEFITNKH